MDLSWIVVVVSLFESSSSQQEADPCVSYTELRDAHRSRFYRYQEEDFGRCDEKLSLAWYRFRGKAGLKMPDSCVDPGFCGTHSPGWFQGKHPSISDGIRNGNVCFNWMGECCFWLNTVMVKNCSGFYVYRLPPTIFCDLLYCGDGASDLDCMADNNDVIVNSSVSGSISSPNFPADYPNNLQCTWRITAPEGKNVRLVLKNMAFGADDYVMFRDGIQDDSPEIAKYSNCAKGKLRLYSSDRYMLITFVSVGNSSSTGFQLDYDMVLSNNCSLNNDVRSLFGVVRSPRLPQSPSGNLDCHWNLLMPAGYKILTLFSWFGMIGKSTWKYCADDYIEVHMEGASQSEKYCGCDIPSKRLYDRERVNVTFYNNRTADQAGFVLYYKAVAPDECLEGVESCEMNMLPVGTNNNGELCYEPGEKPTAPPPTTTKPTTSRTSVTASIPRTTIILQEENVLDVACGEDIIHVALEVRSALVYEAGSVRLNDPSCKPYFVNSTHIFIRLSLGTCGMTRNTSEDDQEVVYQNAIHFNVKRAPLGSYVTRDYEAVFVFQCRYKRLAILSTISFNPARVYVVTNAASFGSFTFEMNISKSEEYKEYYNNYPVGPVDLGDKIFFQVSVQSNDSELVVFVDECKATPTSDFNDKTQYNFMEEGCSKDNTIQYNYSLSSVQRFSMSAFRFRAVSSKEIFFHCQVKVCRLSDLSSRCAEGCPFSKRKKRAAGHEVEGYLAVGPIIVTSGVSSKDEQSSIAFETLGGIFGFVALVLVTAFLVFILKHRAKSKKEEPIHQRSRNKRLDYESSQEETA